MRFGTRRGETSDDVREQEQEGGGLFPVSRSVSEVAAQPVVPSRRLQRVAEHFHAQGQLLTEMREQFEQEMEPLHDLLVRQNAAMQRLLQNLEERLRPLNEYADGEEANLDALERRIEEGGADHVARSFRQYVDEQRSRINATRQQIDSQRVPFVQYGEDQRDTVEVALSRFDTEIQRLEENLTEQRRVMMQMLDDMRSESFLAVRDYLLGRIEALARLAESGTTDPAEIGNAVHELRRMLESMAGNSTHVRAVLDRATEADDQLIAAAAPGARPHVVVREAPAAFEEDEADEQNLDLDEEELAKSA